MATATDRAAIGARPSRRQRPRSERRSHLWQSFDLPACDTFELEADPERYRRLDRHSAFGFHAAVRALKNDPLDPRAELDDGSLVGLLLHRDFAAGACDLGCGIALDRYNVIWADGRGGAAA